MKFDVHTSMGIEPVTILEKQRTSTEGNRGEYTKEC